MLCPPQPYPSLVTPQPYPSVYKPHQTPWVQVFQSVPGGTHISNPIDVLAPVMSIRVIDTSGTATCVLSVYDSSGGLAGALASDPISNARHVYGTSTYDVKGLTDQAQISLQILTGSASVWVSFKSDVGERASDVDRNPYVRTAYADTRGILGPVSLTTLLTYTCPNGVIARLDNIFLLTRRYTVSAGWDGASDHWVLTQAQYYASDSGGASNVLQAINLSFTADTFAVQQGSNLGFMKPGDTLKLQYYDGSQASFNWYVVGYKITELAR